MGQCQSAEGQGSCHPASAPCVSLLTNLLMLISEEKVRGWKWGQAEGGWVALWGPPDNIEGSALIVTTGQKILQPHPVPAADEHLELFLGVNPKGGGSRFPFPSSVACKYIFNILSAPCTFFLH